jgi:hypothetical protein
MQSGRQQELITSKTNTVKEPVVGDLWNVFLQE